MKRLWRLLNSKRFAVYMLFVLLLLLVASTLLPSEITVSARKWYSIQQENPLAYWLATHFSTPYLVRSPGFIVLSLFLFLSTFSCTVQRLRSWVRLRKSEFEKDKAFSFQAEAASAEEPETVKQKLLGELRAKGWECQADGGMVAAQKGLALGFWGSVVFHMGLVICFFAAPVTALSLFRGELVVTDGATISLKEGISAYEGAGNKELPDVDITVHDLWGVYEKGKYKVDFGGRITIGGWDVPFSVNNPVDYKGYQISLHEYGYAPGVEIENNGGRVFDYFLNLRHPAEGDYFPMGEEGLELFVLFFPDFVREDNILSSRSTQPDNPVLLVKFMKDGKALHKGLLIKKGEEAEFGEYRVRFTGLRNWATLIVVRELGVAVIALGFIIGIPGLFIRFLSNERRLEFAFREARAGTEITLRGYSRYYPAFLEREVKRMADRLVEGG